MVMMLFQDLPTPAIIAHRGASAYAPENTLAAFRLALQQGADGIELDAKLSADQQIVVIHDQTVDRTTPHHGAVRDFRLSDLRKMDAGSHFDIAFKGEAIPTLEEVFKAVGQLTYINVELTNYASITDSLPARAVELVRQYKLAHRVLFSSFNPIALARVRRLAPEIPIGLLAFPGRKGGLARSVLGRLLHYQSLHPEVNDVNPALVNRVHRQGNKMVVWTVNQTEQMRHLFGLGVDGIFTDDPILAQKVLREYTRNPANSEREVKE